MINSAKKTGMFKKSCWRVVLLATLVFFLPATCFGYEQTLYVFPFNIGSVGAGGGLGSEYERKITSHCSMGVQLYGNSEFGMDLIRPREDKGLNLIGLGITGRWYFVGEAFSGTYLGIGASLKSLTLKHFIDNRLAGEGEGWFYLPFIEFGLVRPLSDSIRYGTCFLVEHATGENASGIAKEEEGWHFSLIFKLGVFFKDSESLKPPSGRN